MSTEELDKIKLLFEEAKRMQAANADWQLNMDFFALWRNMCRPRPILLKGDSLKVFNRKISLQETEKNIAYYDWSRLSNTPVLRIESGDVQTELILGVEDGIPAILDKTTSISKRRELGYGEKLEIVYDVVEYVRKNYSGQDVRKFTKKRFVETFCELADHYPPGTERALKKIKLAPLKKMINEVCEEMPDDEITGQLMLPFDMDDEPDVEAEIEVEEEEIEAPPPELIPPLPEWEAAEMIEELTHCCQKSLEYENNFSLPLSSVKILNSNETHDIPLELPIPSGLEIVTGDILNVYKNNERDTFGTLRVDEFDMDVVYGRLRCDDGPAFIENPSDFSVRRRAVTARLMALLMTDLLGQWRNKTLHHNSAVDRLLGNQDCPTAHEANAVPPEFLESSQAAAWLKAVNDKNPTVLVQGPPGTGKTFLLEQVLRQLCLEGKRLLVTAPSNTAVDNICRRIMDQLPVLRFGGIERNIASDVAENCWIGHEANIRKFRERRDSCGGGIYAGTHAGLLKQKLIGDDIEINGLFDVILFDEAGMSRLEEFLLCAAMARRTILFGDHRQLPPFPRPDDVLKDLEAQFGPMPEARRCFISGSALEYLAEFRGFPVELLKSSFRCQNPRLLRFSSTLFYDAEVKPSRDAEYYQLSFPERMEKYPQSTLRLYSTSGLPEEMRFETLVFEGGKPGLENRTEALLCCAALYRALKRCPLNEIVIIAPYRRQVSLLRWMVSREISSRISGRHISSDEWRHFVTMNISTVDSFQGGESDVTIICYVRSNNKRGIGFVGAPNRINVAHTRSRREMYIIGDMDCLENQGKSNIFVRMKRALARDGQYVNASSGFLYRMAKKYAPELTYIYFDPNLAKPEKTRKPTMAVN
jgi:AAA domain